MMISLVTQVYPIRSSVAFAAAEQTFPAKEIQYELASKDDITDGYKSFFAKPSTLKTKAINEDSGTGKKITRTLFSNIVYAGTLATTQDSSNPNRYYFVANFSYAIWKSLNGTWTSDGSPDTWKDMDYNYTFEGTNASPAFRLLPGSHRSASQIIFSPRGEAIFISGGLLDSE
ncbi:hypothetical protein FHS14_003975 [Paenibacillus baekrokdamisoli]|nr:hypothetical protein [Paenibacillus baekrokdamisoli]MBB3070973.1 hypothetical protein [Paenibacillus baekrokdamisoli]